jgi:Icc-related predicted phosphoesterase
MKILVVGDPHGDISKIRDSELKKADIILIPGDIGKATLARKHAFETVERKKQGLSEKEYTPKESLAVHMEIHNSTINILKHLVKFAPVYTIQGNVGIPSKRESKRREKKYKLKHPSTKDELKKIKNLHLVKNRLMIINGLRIGFLEYFVDNSWVKEFKSKDKKVITSAKRGTKKAEKVLRGFNNLDILLCHQPPFGVLDRVNFPGVPKDWLGKRAGSKVILNYIKKKQPRYVFCGHMHENKGKAKIGKTLVYNAGSVGDYVLLDIK